MPQHRETAAGALHWTLLKVEMGARATVSVAYFQWCLLVCIRCLCPVIPDSFSQISLLWVRLLQSMNAMISVFPVLALRLMLRSPASDLVPCFSDAKQLFGSCNQAFLMLAEQVTSIASLLSVSMLYVASLFLSLLVLPVPGASVQQR